MIDKIQKLQILEEILKSDIFNNSKLNSKLLTYLVQSDILGKSLSEYAIALEVFNKDASFNPNEDTLVRVSVYNLRKKLEQYYENIGKRNKIRVKIPKGHYEVIFFNFSKQSFKEKLKNPYLTLVPLVILLSMVIIYLLFFNFTDTKKQISVKTSVFSDNYFDEFLNSRNPKIIALGDDFIYYSDFSEFNTTPIRKMYRNSMINSEGEFEKFKSEDSNRENYKKLPFSFFNQAAVWPVPHLIKHFKDYEFDFLIRSATTLNSNDIKSNDIIFLGSFWTLGILNKITKNLGIDYKIVGQEKLIINTNKNDSSKSYIREGIPAFDHIDYCTFIKVQGPNKNIIYLIVSFYATGTVGAVKYLSDEKKIIFINEYFISLYGNIPEYYIILFKSKGFNREVLSTELIFGEKINVDSILW